MKEISKIGTRCMRRSTLIQLAIAAVLIIALFTINWIGGNL